MGSGGDLVSAVRVALGGAKRVPKNLPSSCYCTGGFSSNMDVGAESNRAIEYVFSNTTMLFIRLSAYVHCRNPYKGKKVNSHRIYFVLFLSINSEISECKSCRVKKYHMAFASLI